MFDFDKDVATAANNSAPMAIIGTLVKLQVELEQEVEEAEAHLKQLKERLRNVQERELPDAMMSCNCTSFATNTGQTVTIKDDLSISVPKDAEKRSRMMGWLREHGYENVIKADVRIPFVKGEQEKLESLVDLLSENGFQYEQEDVVAPQTLKKILREELEKGSDITLSDFGAYQWRKTIINQ